MSWQLFDKIRAFFAPTNIFGHENIVQNQSDIDRMMVDNEIINYNSKGLIDQTNLQINRLERYKDFDQMSEMGEISLALDLYADEGTQIDSERKSAILIKAKNLEIKDELYNLFHNILAIDNKLRPMMRYLCKYGDFAMEIVPSVHRNAVTSIRPMNIYNFLRVETKYGDLVGFYFTDIQSNVTEPVFLHPWQVSHMRLTSYENIYAPYGCSILEGARKDFRRLRLMEDAALVYRITRAPVKRVFKIPVGNIPASQVPAFLNQISDQFKKHRFYDPATGEVNWKYAPLIQEDDFWMPTRPDGTGPQVETLPGAENLDQIADIEYFKKKMIAALKIPFERVGIGANAQVGADKSLASSSSEFAKAVHWIQMEMSLGLKKIALVHLALAGYGIEDLNHFDITLTASSAIDELYRIETWNSRVSVIGGLKETGLFPDKWILEHFTDMTEDEIDQMKEEQKKEQPKDEEEGEPDIGMLAGLGESSLINTTLEKQVINEYKNREPKTKEKYPALLDSMINSNDLNGLPQSTKSTENKLITEDINIKYVEQIIQPTTEEYEQAKNETKQIILHSYVQNNNEDTNTLTITTEDDDGLEKAIHEVIQSK